MAHLERLVRRAALLAVAALGLTVGPLARAAPLALDVSGGVPYVRGTFQNFGWYFNVTTPQEVVALGLFDVGADGLTDAHPVGIWDASGTLLTTATITNADPLTPSADAAQGAYRFAPVTPILLAPGSYAIGAYYPTTADLFIGNATGLTTAPGITYLQAGVTPGVINGFHDLTGTDTGADPGFFGPDFLVPEPGSAGLLASFIVLTIAVASIRRARH